MSLSLLLFSMFGVAAVDATNYCCSCLVLVLLFVKLCMIILMVLGSQHKTHHSTHGPIQLKSRLLLLFAERVAVAWSI